MLRPPVLAATMMAAASMATVGLAQDDPENAELLGSWDGFAGTYADVWGDGQHAFVGHFGDAGVHILDISDPAAPVVVEYRLPPPIDDASAQDVKVAEGMLFVSVESDSSGSVHIVDVSDPLEPVALGDIAIVGFTAIHNVFYADGFLYMADSGTPRVGIIDLRNVEPKKPPASPITETYWVVENVGSSFVHDITVLDGRLYAAAWDSGLWVYDVTNVADEPPVFLGAAPGNNTHSCWPTSDSAYVVTGEERAFGGIKVFRVIENVGSIDLQLTDSLVLPSNQAFSVHNQVIDGYRLYNSWYQAGLQVFDIDPVTGELEFFASFDTSPNAPNGFSGAWGVYPFLGPERVLVSDMQNGLHVVSVCVGVENDCNCNGVDDAEDLGSGDSADCNGNGVPDECDIAAGLLGDCNANGVPDDCEGDCNCNGVDDADEIAGGAPDCNGNGRPDECDDDCNGDGVPDECDDDCNGNGVPDGCDLQGGVSIDCNDNGVPDECESDCNCNGVDDADELATGSADDCDEDGIPDDCVTTFRSTSAPLGPVGHPDVLVYEVSEAPLASGEATIRLTARADLNGPTEWVFVQVGTELVPYQFFGASGSSCASSPDEDLAVIDGELINDQISGGVLEIRVIPNSSVNADSCPDGFVRVELVYPTVGADDCDDNGVPDFCDIATGAAADDDRNGVPDACDCPADTDGTGTVDVDDLVNVILDWNTAGITHNGDVDRSGLVDVDDLVMVIVSWGDCR